MTTFRSEDVLVGLIGLVLLPSIALRIVRGVRDGRLPLYRAYVSRTDSEAKFAVLLGFHVATFFVVAAIAADLLFGLNLKEAL